VTRLSSRVLAIGVLAAASVALLMSGESSAAATDAGRVASIVNANFTSRPTGNNFNPVQITAPAACSRAATRHVTKITAVTPADPADRAAAMAWVGDNLYATASVGLPGPLTVQSSNSWQGLADGFGQKLVPGRYDLVLRCQDNLGTKIYEEWHGSVSFSSRTAWRGFTATATAAGTTAATPPVTGKPEDPTPRGAVSPTGKAAATGKPAATGKASTRGKATSRGPTNSTTTGSSAGATPEPSSESASPALAGATDVAEGDASISSEGQVLAFSVMGGLLALGTALAFVVRRRRRHDSIRPSGP
jgi:hypothetical protein